MSSTVTSSVLFEEWNKEQVLYCHWKSNEHLVPGLEGATDLDVLVAETSRDVAERVLLKQGFKKVITQYGTNYPMVEDWLNIDVVSANLIHIHLHYRMATGHKGLKEYSLPWAETMLSSRVLYEDVYICEPNLELVVLYTRIALKASGKILRKAKAGLFSVDGSIQKEIEYLKARADYDKVYAILLSAFKDDSAPLFGIIKKDDLSANDLLVLYRICVKHMQEFLIYDPAYLFFMKPIMKYTILLRSYIRKILHKNIIVKKTISGHGLMVAFIGQDGAGKSTVISDIEKWLTYKLDAKKFYLGSGNLRNSWQKKCLARLAGAKGRIVDLIKGILVVSDLKKIAKRNLKILMQAKRYSLKGGVALFDRFPQTQYSGINDGPKIRERLAGKTNGKLINWFIAIMAQREEKLIAKAACISPNVVFKLMLSPEESMRRKPEENYDMVCKKHDIISALEFSNSTVHVVDAAMEYQEELVIIKKAIWDALTNFRA